MSAAVRTGILIGMLAAVACTGEVSPLGVEEPIAVQGAELRRGHDLPGAAELEEGPRVTAIESTGGIWAQGQLDRTLQGRASEETWAIGLEIVGLGSGYWSLPVGALDPAFPGERVWSVELDVSGGLPPGLHTLRVVAIDESGRGGAWSELDVCVTDPRVADNFNACDPTLPPPAGVVALTWDDDVDLDLVVVTPDGKTVDARHPTTALADDSGRIPPEVLRDPTVGRLDGDSLAACEPDGRNSESLTFQEPPGGGGTYLVYVNLFDACGHPSVRFAVTTYAREQTGEGQFRLVQTGQTTGALMSMAANGGAGSPLYVTAVEIP
ncbi:hypothetical protein [Sandaracinus amylolyticus]|uniref:hypothetical protein n=1 Tax=Sandaracinus amylolyticus TaxID=927083 RepID=UPI001F232705|nr:hypothetical protein [Sandaracinus amylolyticus]UJR81751.1 Hypothetical protein I5071_38110 [Sandaracinus amylolyticus]